MLSLSYPEQIADLILEHSRNTLTATEASTLNAWLDQSEANQLLFAELTDPDRLNKLKQEYFAQNKDRVLQKFRNLLLQRGVLAEKVKARQSEKRGKKIRLIPEKEVNISAAISLIPETTRSLHENQEEICRTRRKNSRQAIIPERFETQLNLDFPLLELAIGNMEKKTPLENLTTTEAKRSPYRCDACQSPPQHKQEFGRTITDKMLRLLKRSINKPRRYDRRNGKSPGAAQSVKLTIRTEKMGVPQRRVLQYKSKWGRGLRCSQMLHRLQSHTD